MRSCTPQLSAHHAPPEHTAAVQVEHTQLKHIAPPKGRPTSASCITSVAACAAGATASAAADSTAAAARGACAKGRASLAPLPSAGVLRHTVQDQSAQPTPNSTCAVSTSRSPAHLTLLLLLRGSHYPGGPLARCHRPLCGLVQAGACRRHGHHGGGSHGVWAVLVAEASSASHYLRNPDFGTDFSNAEQQLHDACSCHVVARLHLAGRHTWLIHDLFHSLSQIIAAVPRRYAYARAMTSTSSAASAAGVHPTASTGTYAAGGTAPGMQPSAQRKASARADSSGARGTHAGV